MIYRNTNVPIGPGFSFFIDFFLIPFSFGARLVCVEVLLRVIYAPAHLCRWNPPWPGFSYRTSGPQDWSARLFECSAVIYLLSAASLLDTRTPGTFIMRLFCCQVIFFSKKPDDTRA